MSEVREEEELEESEGGGSEGGGAAAAAAGVEGGVGVSSSGRSSKLGENSRPSRGVISDIIWSRPDLI